MVTRVKTENGLQGRTYTITRRAPFHPDERHMRDLKTFQRARAASLPGLSVNAGAHMRNVYVEAH